MSNSKFPALKNPPITEALLEILFTLEEGFNIKEFDSFNEKIPKEFIKKEKITTFEGKLDATSIESNSFKSEVIGNLFLNENKSKAIQIRKNGFVYSISNNSYSDWLSFKEEAWNIFSDLKKVYDIRVIKRISLRFINSINLPTNITEIRDYVRIAPDIPKELPFGLNKMFSQITMPNEIIDATGIVTQTFDIGWAMGETFEYIFDIDVQKIFASSPSDHEILLFFDALREFKNQIFFHTITDKTLEIIEK